MATVEDTNPQEHYCFASVLVSSERTGSDAVFTMFEMTATATSILQQTLTRYRLTGMNSVELYDEYIAAYLAGSFCCETYKEETRWILEPLPSLCWVDRYLECSEIVAEQILPTATDWAVFCAGAMKVWAEQSEQAWRESTEQADLLKGVGSLIQRRLERHERMLEAISGKDAERAAKIQGQIEALTEIQQSLEAKTFP